MSTAQGYAAGRTDWVFPDLGEQPAPRGANVLLLTEGEVCVRGIWTDDGRFLAWAPLPKVDKNKLGRVIERLKEKLK